MWQYCDNIVTLLSKGKIKSRISIQWIIQLPFSPAIVCDPLFRPYWGSNLYIAGSYQEQHICSRVNIEGAGYSRVNIEDLVHIYQGQNKTYMGFTHIYTHFYLQHQSDICIHNHSPPQDIIECWPLSWFNAIIHFDNLLLLYLFHLLVSMRLILAFCCLGQRQIVWQLQLATCLPPSFGFHCNVISGSVALQTIVRAWPWSSVHFHRWSTVILLLDLASLSSCPLACIHHFLACQLIYI